MGHSAKVVVCLGHPVVMMVVVCLTHLKVVVVCLDNLVVVVCLESAETDDTFRVHMRKSEIVGFSEGVLCWKEEICIVLRHTNETRKIICKSKNSCQKMLKRILMKHRFFWCFEIIYGKYSTKKEDMCQI